MNFPLVDLDGPQEIEFEPEIDMARTKKIKKAEAQKRWRQKCSSGAAQLERARIKRGIRLLKTGPAKDAAT